MKVKATLIAIALAMTATPARALPLGLDFIDALGLAGVVVSVRHGMKGACEKPFTDPIEPNQCEALIAETRDELAPIIGERLDGRAFDFGAITTASFYKKSRRCGIIIKMRDADERYAVCALHNGKKWKDKPAIPIVKKIKVVAPE